MIKDGSSTEELGNSWIGLGRILEVLLAPSLMDEKKTPQDW